MTNRIIASVALFVAISLATTQESTAQVDESRFYGGVSTGFLNYEALNGPNGSSVVLNGRLGLYINEHLSGEVRLGLGLGDQDHGGGLIISKVDSIIGLYGRLSLPTKSSFIPYAALGISHARATLTVQENLAAFVGLSGSHEDTWSDTGLSYGIGFDWIVDLIDGFRLNAEFTRYNEIEGEGNDFVEGMYAFSIGFTYDF